MGEMMYEELFEEEIKEYNEGLKDIINSAESLKIRIVNCMNAPDIEEQLKKDGDEFLFAVTDSAETFYSIKNELESYLEDEELMDVIRFYNKKFDDMEGRMVYCLNLLNEIDSFTNEIIDKIKKVKPSSKNVDSSSKMNDFRTLDL